MEINFILIYYGNGRVLKFSVKVKNVGTPLGTGEMVPN